MPKMKVIRDATGTLINIGPWDFQIAEEQVIDPISGQPVFDKLDGGGFIPRMKKFMRNPLPEGAYEDEAEIAQDDVKGLYEVKP